MAKGAKKTVKKGIVKKKWVPIIAPALFNGQTIGESLVADPAVLKGRALTVSSSVVLGDSPRHAVRLGFRITEVKEGRAMTELTGFKMPPSATRKLVRRRRDKIADSFVVRTKDEKLVRIKPLVTTRGKTTGSVLTTMRKLVRAYLAKMISETKYADLLSEIVGKKLQKGLAEQLRRLFPIAGCDIRMFEVIPEDKVDVGLKIVLPPEHLPDFASKKAKPEQVEVPQETVEQAA